MVIKCKFFKNLINKLSLLEIVMGGIGVLALPLREVTFAT